MVVLIFIYLTINEVRNLFICFCHLHFFSIGELLLHIIWPIFPTGPLSLPHRLAWVSCALMILSETSLSSFDLENIPLAAT